MIVVNKTTPPRPLILARPMPPTKTGLVQHQPVVLMPGSNEIPDDMKDIMEKSATIQTWLKKRWVEVKKTDKGAEKGASGVGQFDQETAVELINDCFDMKLLARWKEGEKREPVRVAMIERIALLKETARDE